MSFINGRAAVLSACLVAATSAASATTVTLAGEGVMIRYEDKAAELLGAPSLIATTLIGSSASFAAVQGSTGSLSGGSAAVAPRQARSISSLARDERPRSFSEGVAMRFSLAERRGHEPALHSLLLAGIGLFWLIARQRIRVLFEPRMISFPAASI